MEMMNQGYLMASGYHGSNQHNETTNLSIFLSIYLSLQGMEMMNQGYLMASGYHGSNQHNEATNQSGTLSDSPLS